MNMNELYVNVLKSMSMLTDKKECWIIGSSALVLLSQGFPTKFYKKMINDSEDFCKRDIDFVVTSNYDIISKLRTLGSMNLSKTTKLQYQSLMFKTRNISKIESYEFKLGNTNDAIGPLLTSILDYKEIKINIDIVTLNGSIISNMVFNWPVPETKRNFGVYYRNGILSYDEITYTNKYKNLSSYSLCNMIETLKNLQHHYGSPITGYTMVGDKVKRNPYNYRHYTEDQSSTSMQSRLYHVLLGNSIELVKHIHIKTHHYHNFPKEQKDSDVCCPTCLTLLEKTKCKLIILKCGHIFCVGCIVPMWIGYLIMRYNRLNETFSDDEADPNFNKCPVCRKEIFKIHNNQEFENTYLDTKDWKIDILNF